MDKPNFRKMSRAALHEYAAELYGTNPRHSAAAKAELDRRNLRIKLFTIAVAIFAAIIGLLNLLNKCPQEFFPSKSAPQILKQQKNTDEKATKRNDIQKKDHNPPPIQNKENKK